MVAAFPKTHEIENFRGFTLRKAIRMNRAWLINSRGLAKKVKNAGHPSAYQIKDCGANRQCPNCHYLIDNSDVSHEWPGLPAGVKFDPSDVELLEHLAAKNGVGDLEPHDFIDEFIPTIKCDGGICYTHPENLPGAKKDGSNAHFFYRITNAYASGQRKRRRIQLGDENTREVHVRWHKTGKTKPVLQNGVHIGFKKIMVLYATSKGGSKPGKCNWVMHQYHLGTDVDEREGEFVVSKVSYQGDKNETYLVDEDYDPVNVVPRTPKTNTPDRHRQEKTPLSECGSDDYALLPIAKESEYLHELPHSGFGCKMETTEYATSLAQNCEADSLLCNEKIDSYPAFADPHVNMSDHANAYCGISDLDDLELDTPPDFHSDLQFPSQDSVFDFLERL